MVLQRVAYVLQLFPKLSETFVAGELAELRRRGVELRILSLLPPRAELQHNIVRRACLTEITSYDVGAFASAVREFQPQFLHAHFATESTAKARELSAACEVPFTFTAHGYDIYRKPPPDFHERAMAARAVVTVSDANADYISKTFNVPGTHIRVIPCGVDTTQFCPANAANGEPGPPWIVCVARHVKVKNLGLLLDACAELYRRGVAFRCAMIGDGPLHTDLKARRAELGLEGVVEMPGPAEQGEVLKWWQRAAVGVLTSEHEGMPVSLMEAAACGVPVVAPAVGGVPELVSDGQTGLLARPNDLDSFVSALEQLLRDRERRTRMGESARRRAVEKFSVSHQVDQLLALWSELLNAEARG
jgi:glycosyltransferase involved in cell wall biosynthesis